MTPATGSGPGAITADGCSVEVYAALPAGVEPDVVAAAVAPPAWLLELGAGAGRVTHALIARGYQVVAVDDSPEMLARITGAETVVSSIEGLDLGRRFDGVLLCSHLVNSPEPQRDAFVATCARHVAGDGCVVIERHEPAWFDEAEAVTVEVGGVVMSLGEMIQAAAAFVIVQGAFNWLVDNYARVADWLSSVHRVVLLLDWLDGVAPTGGEAVAATDCGVAVAVTDERSAIAAKTGG